VQRDQLAHLLTAMRLPSVQLAVIPMDADRRGLRPRESFDITDTSLVTVEMVTGFLSLTHPGWNFQNGDGTNPRHYTFSSDPRTIRDITAAFEIAWDRATPHTEYKTGQ